MKNETSHNILRSSILFEMHGEKLYRETAEKAKDPKVKEFFTQMANDENTHAEILRAQFEYYQRNSKFDSTTNTRYTTNKIEEIKTSSIAKLIEYASFEAAAVTAAVLMEEKSVIEYRKMANEAKDPEEIRIYNWLADWEQEHVNRLSTLRDNIQTKMLITEKLEA